MTSSVKTSWTSRNPSQFLKSRVPNTLVVVNKWLCTSARKTTAMVQRETQKLASWSRRRRVHQPRTSTTKIFRLRSISILSGSLENSDQLSNTSQTLWSKHAIMRGNKRFQTKNKSMSSVWLFRTTSKWWSLSSEPWTARCRKMDTNILLPSSICQWWTSWPTTISPSSSIFTTITWFQERPIKTNTSTKNQMHSSLMCSKSMKPSTLGLPRIWNLTRQLSRSLRSMTYKRENSSMIR